MQKSLLVQKSGCAKFNVYLDSSKHISSACHYLTRADLTGRDWASCEKGGCIPSIKTRWLLHGKQVWSVIAKEQIYMKIKKKKRHVEQTWLSQIHSHLFTAKLTHNDNTLLTITLCCRINQIIYISYRNSPQIFTFYFCLIIWYVTKNILKLCIDRFGITPTKLIVV